MTNKSKQKEPNQQVMFLVRRGKRGYIVEAAGGDPYPCLDASDIGDAVIEILDDPDQPAVEAAAPELEEPKARPPQSEAYEEDEEHEPERERNVRPNGWTAGDELLVGLAGSLLNKARKFSDWERS